MSEQPQDTGAPSEEFIAQQEAHIGRLIDTLHEHEVHPTHAINALANALSRIGHAIQVAEGELVDYVKSIISNNYTYANEQNADGGFPIGSEAAQPEAAQPEAAQLEDRTGCQDGACKHDSDCAVHNSEEPAPCNCREAAPEVPNAGA